MDFLTRGIRALSGCADGGSRARTSRGRERRRLAVELLEARQMLALTHLYTFNDGLANDWVGNAHGTLVNGATVTAGQLVLANGGVTSGQSSVVQHMRLPAGVLPAGGSFTIVAWYTTSDAAAWARVFDVGDQTGASGNSYVFFTPRSGFDDSRGAIRGVGAAERVAGAATTDDGEQHMAAVVVDVAAGLLRLYIDGVEASTAPLEGTDAGSVNDAVAYLGRSLFNADPGFTGSINELRIYDEARTAEDVLADATAGPSTATRSPLVRQLEYLDRGVVAIRRTSTQAYVSWRLLGTDPADVAFNVYRSANGGAAVKLNGAPITATTDFVDSTANFAMSNQYLVRPVVGGVELAEGGGSFAIAAGAAVGYYLEVPLDVPAGGTSPNFENPGQFLPFTYSANDVSVGDVDGDGQYEIILKWEPSNARDNSQSGYTGNVLIDAYRLDGTRLWRIDLGRNIRAGAHYTQLMVYDFDGDGRAEVAMKAAPGTIDGQGNAVLLPGHSAAADYRNSSGYILTGPEYLTVFNGLTGAAMATVPLEPARGSVTQWGDSYGNRVDRFTATPAYLDGVRPSLVIGRGYYGPQSSGGQARNEIAAYDFRNGELTLRWHFRAGRNINGNINSNYIGQGAHAISVADVDGDGKDEIIYGAAVIDDNGQGLHTSGLGHGDALHVSDMIPSRPGLEIFMPHESAGSNGNVGFSVRDARTGELLVSASANNDVGRGVAADIDPNHPGYEFWATTSFPGQTRSIYNSAGDPIYAAPSNMHVNHLVWWDADLERETLDGTTISNWNYTTAGRSNIDLNPNQSGTQSAPGVSSINGTKSNPNLSADLFGDWREEVIWRTSGNTALRIFTTPIAATNRLVTLMHDSQYRQAIAWQNVAYNQPPHPSFFLGAGMAAPPALQAYLAINGDFNGDQRVDGLDLAVWQASAGQAASVKHASGDANGDGVADGADFLAWQRNLGRAATLQVPEAAAAAAAVAPANQEAESAVVVLNGAVVEDSLVGLAAAGLPGADGSNGEARAVSSNANRSQVSLHESMPLRGESTVIVARGEHRVPRRVQFNVASAEAVDCAFAAMADDGVAADWLDAVHRA